MKEATEGKQRRRRTLLLFLGAGLASFGTIVGSALALDLIPSDVFSTYEPTIPVFTTVIALACGYEKPNGWIGVGVFFSAVGAILVEILHQSSGGSGSLLGNLVVVAQCVATGSLLVVTKPLTEDWSPLVVTSGYYVIGTIFTAIVCAAAQIPREQWFWTNIEPWAAEIYSIFVATFFAYEAFSWLVERSSPTFTSAFIPMQPVFTILLNYLILGQGLGFPTAIAGCVVILGLVLTVYGKFKRDTADDEKDQQEEATLAYALLKDDNDKEQQQEAKDDKRTTTGLSPPPPWETA